MECVEYERVEPSLLLSIFEFEPEVGSFIKLSHTCRKVFLAFKHYSKEGKVKHLRHVNKTKNLMTPDFLRRVCSRRIGKNVQSLNFQFTLMNDSHFAKAVLPKSLEELNLNYCRELTEKTMFQIGQQCDQNLKRIEIYWNCLVTDFSIKQLARCSQLENVNISGCKFLTDASVQHLADNCPNIEILNITRLELLTDEVFAIIGKGFPNLRDLYLYANAHLTDEGFKTLARSEFKNLQLLDLCGCQHLTDETLVEICRKNSSLHSLNLTWCISLTDVAICEGIANCGLKLTLLSLFGNTNVTQKSLEALIESNQDKLETLDFNGCREIPEGDRTPEVLKKSFPACTEFIYHS